MKARSRSFDVNFTLIVAEDNNILSSHEEYHAEDMADLVADTFYDIDDVEASNISVEEKKGSQDDSRG